MNPVRPEDAQSFLLRFWYERSETGPSQWRGAVWSQSLGPDDPHLPVADPEQAFEIVRRALAGAAPADGAPPESPPAPAGFWRRLVTRLRGVGRR
ncbi:hypothetical protein [Salinarimonas sp.]|uniref:hypothetical protein n=1 Tax=Salinarimonas sp. TaxID=2766526 RepID=UPI0032D8DFCB